MTYGAAENRYETMRYNRCGQSGILLPAIALGLWHNFGGIDDLANGRAIIRRAFDAGVTHFDLANNYGPPPGSAEETFGTILRTDLAGHRDELIVSTKAGYLMWPGPYGEWGSKKYLIASLDQSLRRLGLEYVDIFYSHRPDPKTPFDETMEALDQAISQGKALYAGLSNYTAEQTRQAAGILRRRGRHCLIHQPKYSMFVRGVEEGLLEVLAEEGIGCVAFSPLAQGLLTERYLQGIPADSRAAKQTGFLQKKEVTEQRIEKVRALQEIARQRGQSITQMALAWVLRDPRVTSALIGVSSVRQLEENLSALDRLDFGPAELARIDAILA